MTSAGAPSSRRKRNFPERRRSSRWGARLPPRISSWEPRSALSKSWNSWMAPRGLVKPPIPATFAILLVASRPSLQGRCCKERCTRSAWRELSPLCKGGERDQPLPQVLRGNAGKGRSSHRVYTHRFYGGGESSHTRIIDPIVKVTRIPLNLAGNALWPSDSTPDLRRGTPIETPRSPSAGAGGPVGAGAAGGVEE
jgi:hypothetical protein